MGKWTCCFAGFGVKDCADAYDFNVYKPVEEEAEKAIKIGYRVFISPVSNLFELKCAEIILKFKEKYKDIELICMPIMEEQNKLTKKEQTLFKKVVSFANKVVCNYGECKRGVIYKRNVKMLNNSSLLISLYKHIGNVQDSIFYALTKGKKIIVINKEKAYQYNDIVRQRAIKWNAYQDSLCLIKVDEDMLLDILAEAEPPDEVAHFYVGNKKPL